MNSRISPPTRGHDIYHVININFPRFSLGGTEAPDGGRVKTHFRLPLYTLLAAQSRLVSLLLLSHACLSSSVSGTTRPAASGGGTRTMVRPYGRLYTGLLLELLVISRRAGQELGVTPVGRHVRPRGCGPASLARECVRVKGRYGEKRGVSGGSEGRGLASPPARLEVEG